MIKELEKFIRDNGIDEVMTALKIAEENVKDQIPLRGYFIDGRFWISLLDFCKLKGINRTTHISPKISSTYKKVIYPMNPVGTQRCNLLVVDAQWLNDNYSLLFLS